MAGIRIPLEELPREPTIAEVSATDPRGRDLISFGMSMESDF